MKNIMKTKFFSGLILSLVAVIFSLEAYSAVYEDEEISMIDSEISLGLRKGTWELVPFTKTEVNKVNQKYQAFERFVTEDQTVIERLIDPLTYQGKAGWTVWAAEMADNRYLGEYLIRVKKKGEEETRLISLDRRPFLINPFKTQARFEQKKAEKIAKYKKEMEALKGDESVTAETRKDFCKRAIKEIETQVFDPYSEEEKALVAKQYKEAAASLPRVPIQKWDNDQSKYVTEIVPVNPNTLGRYELLKYIDSLEYIGTAEKVQVGGNIQRQAEAVSTAEIIERLTKDYAAGYTGIPASFGSTLQLNRSFLPGEVRNLLDSLVSPEVLAGKLESHIREEMNAIIADEDAAIAEERRIKLERENEEHLESIRRANELAIKKADEEAQATIARITKDTADEEKRRLDKAGSQVVDRKTMHDKNIEDANRNVKGIVELAKEKLEGAKKEQEARDEEAKVLQDKLLQEAIINAEKRKHEDEVITQTFGLDLAAKQKQIEADKQAEAFKREEDKKTALAAAALEKETAKQKIALDTQQKKKAIAHAAAQKKVELGKELVEKEAELQTRYHNGEIAAQGKLARGQETMNTLLQTRTAMIAAGALGVLALSWYASKNGVPVLMEYLQETPETVMETSLLPVLTKVKRAFKPRAQDTIAANDIILSKPLQGQVDELIELVGKAKANNLGYPFALFQGPPGTGKTLAAKIIAKHKTENSEQQEHMDYVIMSGAGLNQLPAGKDIETFNNILKLAQKSKKDGIILFIDEADSMLGDRQNAVQKRIDFVNFFLGKFPETTHPKIFIIMATNFPEKLDKAIMSRVGYTLQFNLPDADQRTKILSLHVQKQLSGFTFDPDVERKMPSVAKAIEGFSGREIQNLAVRLKTQLTLKGEKNLSYDTMMNMVDLLKRQKDSQKHLKDLKKK